MEHMAMAGGVYILNYNDTLNAINYSDPTLIGAEYSKYGYKVTVVDIDHDGIDDQVISAPTDGLNLPGKIFEYLIG